MSSLDDFPKDLREIRVLFLNTIFEQTSLKFRIFYYIINRFKKKTTII